MVLTAPRSILIQLAFCFVMLGITLQGVWGFRLSDEAGRTAEMAAWLLYAFAVVLLLAPMGRARALQVALFGFILMTSAVYLNTHWVTALDVRHGGAYAWSGTRIAVLTMVLGPCAGLIVGVITGLLARFERIRWTKTTVTS